MSTNSLPPLTGWSHTGEMTAVVLVGDRNRRPRWWPPLVLLALVPLIAGVSLANAAQLMPPPVALKSTGVEYTAPDVPVGIIAAPTLSAEPDPTTYIQQIEIILPPPPPPPTGRSSSTGVTVPLNRTDAAVFCAGLNDQRLANGLAALSSCYATTARQLHANATAASFSIWHQGDNIVGYSWSHSSLIDGFMNSQGHRDQILTPSYTGAYVACAWSPNPPAGYANHVFCTADFY